VRHHRKTRTYTMVTALVVIAILLIIVIVLSVVKHQHWVFDVAEFISFQLLFLHLFDFCLTLLYVQAHPGLSGVQAVQFALIVYHIYIRMRYTKFSRQQHVKKTSATSGSVKIVSCNIYQYTTEYQRFISPIRREHPDIFVTMESNADWEQAMRCLEKDYPFQEKVTLENTYGMHFYTKLKVHRLQTHYFVADDIPSIEAELETRDGQRFVFFAVHPPPPSPTEEENSKERDGDLLSVAKKVRKLRLP